MLYTDQYAIIHLKWYYMRVGVFRGGFCCGTPFRFFISALVLVL